MAKGSPHNAGNWNLKGKKHIVLSCGCCDCHNHKEKYQRVETMKEINEYYDSL